MTLTFIEGDLPLPVRDQPWASDRGCDRRTETPVRHLGQQRERGQPNGDHRGAGENTGV